MGQQHVVQQHSDFPGSDWWINSSETSGSTRLRLLGQGLMDQRDCDQRVSNRQMDRLETSGSTRVRPMGRRLVGPQVSNWQVKEMVASGQGWQATSKLMIQRPAGQGDCDQQVETVPRWPWQSTGCQNSEMSIFRSVINGLMGWQGSCGQFGD